MKEKTAQPETSIALIQKDIEYMKKDVAEIKTSVRELAGIYITKVQFDDALKVVNDELVDLKAKRNLWAWLSPLLASIFTGTVSFFVISYFQNLK